MLPNHQRTAIAILPDPVVGRMQTSTLRSSRPATGRFATDGRRDRGRVRRTFGGTGLERETKTEPGCWAYLAHAGLNVGGRLDHKVEVLGFGNDRNLWHG
jgi:hypothetical protein